MTDRFRRNARLLTAGMVATTLIGGSSTAGARVPALPCAKAKAAVERELARYYDLDYPDMMCQRLSRTKARVRFSGLTNDDVREGNVDGHSGLAYARRYSYGVDVSVAQFRWGGAAG